MINNNNNKKIFNRKQAINYKTFFNKNKLSLFSHNKIFLPFKIKINNNYLEILQIKIILLIQHNLYLGEY